MHGRDAHGKGVQQGEETGAGTLPAMEWVRHGECPVCRSKRFAPFDSIEFRGHTIRYQRCKACSLVFMNPMPTQDWYNAFYASEFWEDKSVKQAGSKGAHNVKQWKKELNWADKFVDLISRWDLAPGGNPSILEIGCAFGLIVEALADRFHGKALGVEPSDSASAFASAYAGVEVVAKNMDELSSRSGTRADLVLCSHVIENIVDVNKSFRTIREVLRPGGGFVLDTPNVFFQKSVSIFHPYCFCRRSIETVFRRHGFDILGISASGRARGVFCPMYVTVLARKPEGGEVPAEVSAAGDPIFPLKLAAGRALRRLTLLKYVKALDRRLLRTIHPPSSYNRERLARLEAQVTES